MRVVVFFILIFFFSNCSSKVERVDTHSNNLSTVRWGTNEFQEITKKVVDTVLASNIDFSKSYRFEKIKNDTYDHIDTDALSNKIINALLKSKRVKITKNSRVDALFFGKISSIFKKDNHTKDMFFNFNLTLTDTKTGGVIWSEDIEIRKVYKKALFGW